MLESNQPVSRRRFIKSLTYGMAASVIPCACADLSSRNLIVEQRTLVLPNWNVNGFRVALLSDLHIHSPSSLQLAQRAAKLAMDAKPNVIVIPGDLMDRSSFADASWLHPFLAKLEEAECPVFATRGNHDVGRSENGVIQEVFKDYSSELLMNQLAEVDGVTIAGIDSASVGRPKPEIIESARAGLPILALVHEPDYADSMPESVSLQVSGHSHGGQVCLPFGIPINTPALAKKYVAGYFESSKIPLYVSRGVGTVGMRFRAFCPPELSLLTLVGRNS